MGNEQSAEVNIDEKAVEVTDFWTHHSATTGNIAPVSVLIGEPLIENSLWAIQSPLEKSAKNLMLYRHPCILKYISSWHKNSKFYLLVEDVKPLAHVIQSLNVLQIAVGLHSILNALCFLHEKAFVSHNNICLSSIYITNDGNWKLGGMEYLCKLKELTSDYLNKTKMHRYNKSLDPNETKNVAKLMDRSDVIDVYAFGVLATEMLCKMKEDDIPGLKSFYNFCKNDLQQVDVLLRPKFATISDHSFFKHDFVAIHSFLTELPLKSDAEKAEFFSNLLFKLKQYDETVVAGQLGGLLLSRMVLLDKTAQSKLLPFVLCPRKGNDNEEDGLFSCGVFQKYMVPKLLQIFCVRDAQIRLLLLDHFTHFMECFSKEDLQMQILPELLVGIKDTNDQLVAVTLKALSELVVVLGAATVIGGKRAKLFNDGRPTTLTPKKPKQSFRQGPNIYIHPLSHVDISSEHSSGIEVSLELPERPSPDGEEGETSTDEVEQTIEEEEVENWDDWDINEGNHSNANEFVNLDSVGNQNLETSIVENANENMIANYDTDPNNISQSTMSVLQSQMSKQPLPDILELDIKNQYLSSNKKDDFNFFQDMEPVIQTSTKYLVANVVDSKDTIASQSVTYNLDVAESEQHADGWNEDVDWE